MNSPLGRRGHSPHYLGYLLAVVSLLTFIAAVTKPARADALTETQAVLRNTLNTQAATLRLGEVDIRALRLLRRLYAARDYRPLWTEPARRALLAAVADSFNDGLSPADYPRPSLVISDALTTSDHAEQDIVLTESLARLAYSLRFGKANPIALDPDWNYARALGAVDPVAWLANTITGGDLMAALAHLRPPTPQYAVLRSALAGYRALAEQGAWPVISAGATLKPGMTDPRVRELRARLARLGALPAATDDFYDEALAAAVREFQTQHGLAVDGKVGRATLAALNVSVAARIETLRVNLERIRWIFHDLDDEFIAVNIAAFYAAYVQHGEVRWRARVVVGRPYRQTPIFKSRITYLELNPTWTVPPTILAEDILPKLRSSLSILKTKKLQVIDREGRVLDPRAIDWRQIRAHTFPYVLRQPAGDDNALGRIKFMFPNPHSVYLHDTPARDLFDEPERVFSSGCIRIERPLELAEILLRDDPTWPSTALSAALAAGKRQRITLPKPITIMLLYLTAFPDELGRVQFRDDVYARDGAVHQALGLPFEFAPPEDYPYETLPSK
jgi:L,D-transpeptidase YcbB